MIADNQLNDNRNVKEGKSNSSGEEGENKDCAVSDLELGNKGQVQVEPVKNENDDGLESNSKSNDLEELIEIAPAEGRRAWIVVFGSFLMHFIILGTAYAYGVYVVPYTEMFDITRAESSLPYTIAMFVMFLGGVITGRLADMYGIRPVFAIGVLSWSLGYLIAALASEFWQVILGQGVLVGIGSACCFWPGVAIVPQWFEQRRALALGIAVLGSGAGNVVFGIAVERLISVYGTQIALFSTLVVGLICFLTATACMTRRLPVQRKGGLLAEIGVFKDRNFQLICACGLFFNFGYHIPFVYIAAFAEDAGLSSSFAALCVGLVGGGSAAGRVILGFVADKIGRLRAFQVSLFFSSISLFLWPLCTVEVALGIFAVSYGFFSGGFIALNPVVLSEYFGTQRLGGISGLLSLALIPGSLAGPPLFGFLYDSTDQYLTGILLCASFIMLSFLFLLPLPSPAQ